MIALLNSERISNNIPPLGFLNPWIYSTGYRGLNDITLGASIGCNGESGSPRIPGASWNATQGWDPVTGYGSPDFPKLLELAMADAKNYSGEIVPSSKPNRTMVYARPSDA